MVHSTYIVDMRSPGVENFTFIADEDYNGVVDDLLVFAYQVKKAGEKCKYMYSLHVFVLIDSKIFILFVCLSVCLSACLSVCLSVCQFHLLKHKVYVSFLTLNANKLLNR